MKYKGFEEVYPSIYRGSLNLESNSIRNIIDDKHPSILIGHPTFRNSDNIAKQIALTIKGAALHFAEAGAIICVADGSYTHQSKDEETMAAAIRGAHDALSLIDDPIRKNISVVVTPYEGYGNDMTAGKGSALKMLFEEGSKSSVEMFVLLDGDLRNDMSQWLGVFKKVKEFHTFNLPQASYFITARYARHFVDASLTRFIVGPLTTLLGKYVPGGISGDIVLSASAAEHELGEWSDARRKYGTDISTTFDNIADENCVIYEVYLGAKLHDITDEGKLSIMPGEVIGAALESILRHKEKVLQVLNSETDLEEPVKLGSSFTGIEFIDPGFTEVFNVDTKMNTLISKWDSFCDDVRTILPEEDFNELVQDYEQLKKLHSDGEGTLQFLHMNEEKWVKALVSATTHTLRTASVDIPKRALNYLYTAAFLEFCKDRLADLGFTTLRQIREAQKNLGVSPEFAEDFYTSQVDAKAESLARRFYCQRKNIRL